MVMMDESVCPKCNGFKHVRLPSGQLEQCSCVVLSRLRRYLGPALANIKNIDKSDLTRMVRSKKNLVIESPSANGTMTMFKAHLRKALCWEFTLALGQGEQPLTWDEVSMRDVVNVQFDDKMGFEDKQSKLFLPHLLVINAPTWPTYEVNYLETMALMADRLQRGRPTWLVSPDLSRLKSTQLRVPPGFILFIDEMKKDRFIHIPDDRAKLLKTPAAKPVLSTHKGRGSAGVDPSWLALPKTIDVRIAETEQHVKHDSHSGHGQPSSQ